MRVGRFGLAARIGVACNPCVRAAAPFSITCSLAGEFEGLGADGRGLRGLISCRTAGLMSCGGGLLIVWDIQSPS